MRVASKPFGESFILAELFAQLLESRGLAVERKPGLGATEVAFAALRAGAIDVYPEYTGTGLLAILHDPPEADARRVFERVSSEFARLYDVHWLPPLGFENTYAIAVTPATAARLRLGNLTDLSRSSKKMTAGLTPDFIGRPDGLAALEKNYGIHFSSVRPLSQALKYGALHTGAVDVIDGYSTDGLIKRYGLTILRDDRRVFPPYEAAALVSPELFRGNRRAIAALSSLSGRIRVDQMRAWNARVEVDREPVSVVARDALRELGLDSSANGSVRGSRAPSGFGGYLASHRSELWGQTTRHLLLVLVALLAGVLFAVPLGLLLERSRRIAEAVMRAAGAIQTIPSIALLALMIPFLGIGVWPALVALWLYSIYPILRGTYTGVRDANPSAVHSARALGMTDIQLLRYVRLPLATPVILSGIRTAAVITVGTATLAAFVGAGGLGEPIATGLALADNRMILSGAIPAALLALLVDWLLGRLERVVAPPHLRAMPARSATHE